jgi:hypothetical protein
MPVFQLVRRPPQWLRVVLAAMLLAFGANSIAHASHQHDASPTTAAHSLACSYCASFGALGDAPRHTYAAPAQNHRLIPVADPVVAVRSIELTTSAHPRAPPLSRS